MKEENYPVKNRNVNAFIFLAYIILGIYFLSFPFTLPFVVPEYVLKFNSWIVFVGGILMLFGAINYFRVRKR